MGFSATKPRLWFYPHLRYCKSIFIKRYDRWNIFTLCYSTDHSLHLLLKVIYLTVPLLSDVVYRFAFELTNFPDISKLSHFVFYSHPLTELFFFLFTQQSYLVIVSFAHINKFVFHSSSLCLSIVEDSLADQVPLSFHYTFFHIFTLVLLILFLLFLALECTASVLISL